MWKAAYFTLFKKLCFVPWGEDDPLWWENILSHCDADLANLDLLLINDTWIDNTQQTQHPEEEIAFFEYFEGKIMEFAVDKQAFECM